jgi:hypothetical protein
MGLMTDWELLHAYRRLSEAGTVKPLTCPDCDTVLITRLGKDDNPVLWCMTENVFINPGTTTMNQVRAVVMEHTDDRRTI